MSTTVIKVRNPRTGVVDHQLIPPDASELAGRCAALREGQRAWQDGGVNARVAALRAWNEVLGQTPELLTALATDTGRGLESRLELDLVRRSIERWCQAAGTLALDDAAVRSSSSIPTVELHRARRPYPLVGVISPWNFPLLLAMIDTLPALLAGCAVMVKPSEITPRFVAPLQRTVEQVPALRRVLHIVAGGPATGGALVEQADLVCFTGSVPTGRRVAEACARRLIPAFLELGGKDPALVLEGADLSRAASAIAWGGLVNAGQSCLSIERVYVEQSVYDAFLAELVPRVQALRLAHPGPDDGQIGPIISEAQVAILQAHLDDALARGAQARVGGQIRCLDGGLYCEPTVLTGVDPAMKVMTEETFGPILPVMPVEDLDAAVAQANATEYGLSAAVFAADRNVALAVAHRLEAGAISINDAALTAMVHDAEKMAFKNSGLGGSRMGTRAIERFMRTQAMMIHDRDTPDPWWFPTSKTSEP